MELLAPAHPEDAFIAEFAARIGARRATRAERKLARALAAELLDLNPELAYPWGTVEQDALSLAPGALARHCGVDRERAIQLKRELVRWLAQSGRLERKVARLMCRKVSEPAPRAALAA